MTFPFFIRCKWYSPVSHLLQIVCEKLDERLIRILIRSMKKKCRHRPTDNNYNILWKILFSQFIIIDRGSKTTCTRCRIFAYLSRERERGYKTKNTEVLPKINCRFSLEDRIKEESLQQLALINAHISNVWDFLWINLWWSWNLFEV